MKVLQINAVYQKFSTGRNVSELHVYFIDHGINSFIAAPDLDDLKTNCYKIGNAIDRKFHSAFSHIFGLQGYYSKSCTKRLLKYIQEIKPDIIHLNNLHGNYINLYIFAYTRQI